jgi:eukaryotic-like serine/threonine-protein kinase
MTSRAVGSPSYMSPEQLTAARSLDGRADIWALGVVLYELLTQRRPFYAETMPSLVALILKGKFDKLDTLRPDLPPTLVAAVHRCLEAEPDARFATVNDFALALAPFAPADSTSSVEGLARVYAARAPHAPAEDSHPGHGQTGIASVITPVHRAPSPRRLLLSTSAGTLALIGIAAAFVLHGRGPPATSAAPAARETPAPTSSGAPEPTPPAAEAPPPVAEAPGSTASSAAPPPVAKVSAKTPWRPTGHVAHALAPPASAPLAAPQVAPTSPPSVPTCHLVSYFDALGDKHFKQECP